MDSSPPLDSSIRDSSPVMDSAPVDTQIDTMVPTTLRSCLEIHERYPSAESGPYTIEPDGAGSAVDVYCDMVIDGGGWTLVVSSRGEPPADVRIAHYADLTTLAPTEAHIGVTDFMRPVITDRGDLRFACKSDPSATDMRVDLSFYDVDWYREITSGSDPDSCFNEGDGFGFSRPAPMRRDNVSGATRPSGDGWNEDGYLEGEDECRSPNDFTVDFDDRGMDGDESDGTDWGDDDGSRKCGENDLDDGVWFLFAREPGA
jgi:hypothetical protein